MQHCTPEQLALAALREPLPAEDAEHLSGCQQCRAEVASLQRGVDALAVPQLAAPGAAVAPPPRVWAAIAAATGVSAAPRPERVEAAAGPTADPRPAAAPAGPGPRNEIPTPVAEVRQLRPRRPRLLLAVAAGLVAGAAVGGGVVALLQDREDTRPVASTTLDPLENARATGQAAVVERDGTRLLEISLRAPELDDGYYEVWLLQPSVEGLVSVGVVDSGTTVLELPRGLDLGEYPLVDVSVEPLDGDPSHSGVSVARGELDA